MALIAVAPVCFGQPSPSKPEKSTAKEMEIIDLEKSIWETYKNKQADAFRRYLATEYVGVYARGIMDTDAQITDMEKADLRDYTFSDMKAAFPSADVAVLTYKVTTHRMAGGQDVSGLYYGGGAWIKRNGKWLSVFHTSIKAQ